MAKHAIIVFVKNPTLGKVKTRLAQTIGDERALEIYLKLCQYTRELLLDIDSDRYVFYDQSIIQQDDWNSQFFNKKLQHTGDLGDRMHHAFNELLDSYDKVLIIGSDCPEIKKQHIELAFKSLDETDVVIGPSLDGGYYLLGMTDDQSYLFEDMPWSTSHLFGQSIQKIFRRHKSVTELTRLSDVDYEEDLKLVDWL